MTTQREITSHKVNECNEAISITADERNPENGNASHHYTLAWHEQDDSGCDIEICFQNGPIKEVGVNGVTNEALLAIVADRLEGFQSSKWACGENADALIAVNLAMESLKARTAQRIARGVEGTHEV
jgi:hypothetical protein